MRFAAFLEFEQPAYIPPWYRIAFTSLLKEALQHNKETQALYEYYYGDHKKNIPKPFTFAVKLDVCEKISNSHKLKIGRYATLYVSTNNYELLSAFYNGLRSIRQYNIYGTPFKIIRFSLLPNITCSSKGVFSIFSPIVVRRVSDDKKGHGYVNVNDADYIQMLKYSIVSQCKFLGDSYCIKTDDIVIKTNAAFPVKIPHYNKKNPEKPEVIIATDGTIEIQAPQEVVQLLYDNGIGARRSQGFGMLEVMR